MTNRLELNWSLDGIIDEQRYYCSETPIDSENLPVPKAVLAGDIRAYTDFAITEGATYYICVGSVKNGVEKISSEISVVAIKSLVYMPLTGGLQDFGSLGNTWSNTGGVTFDENGALFSTYGQHISSSFQMNFNQDFKITFEIKRLSSTSNYPGLFSNDSGSWTSGNFAMAFAGENAHPIYKNRIMIGVAHKYDLQSSATFSNNVFYSVELARVGNVIKVKVDGVEVTSRIETNTINVTDLFVIGCALNNGANGQFNGYIRNFIVHDVS